MVLVLCYCWWLRWLKVVAVLLLLVVGGDGGGGGFGGGSAAGGWRVLGGRFGERFWFPGWGRRGEPRRGAYPKIRGTLRFCAYTGKLEQQIERTLNFGERPPKARSKILPQIVPNLPRLSPKMAICHHHIDYISNSGNKTSRSSWSSSTTLAATAIGIVLLGTLVPNIQPRKVEQIWNHWLLVSNPGLVGRVVSHAKAPLG